MTFEMNEEEATAIVRAFDVLLSRVDLTDPSVAVAVDVLGSFVRSITPPDMVVEPSPPEMLRLAGQLWVLDTAIDNVLGGLPAVQSVGPPWKS